MQDCRSCPDPGTEPLHFNKTPEGSVLYWDGCSEVFTSTREEQ